MHSKAITITFIFFFLVSFTRADSSDSTMLNKIDVLTLTQGSMTTGKRSSQVPQLKCVGGTAGCTIFVPKVVQCKNKGLDGISVQWECKTEMDAAYKFGKIDIKCEGYSYPEDPLVLNGSCGLEYTLDLTNENSDSIMLTKIAVLTLTHGMMTNARRSSPVPQLKCVGGTAGCSRFVPKVVQCYNKGSDGFIIQWECKTEMNEDYRFGKINVNCEGYSSSTDTNVLKGSCGLEYNLDFTSGSYDITVWIIVGVVVVIVVFVVIIAICSAGSDGSTNSGYSGGRSSVFFVPSSISVGRSSGFSGFGKTSSGFGGTTIR